MQRNILKITLACCMALFLAAAPISSLHAAESTAETVVDAASRSTDAAQTRETYYVNAQSGLKMRRAPSKDSDVITLLPHGTEVTVIGTSNDGWYEIEYSNESGYVSASYVTKVSNTDANTDDDADPDIAEAETDESVPSTETALENIQSTLGITPIITALLAAIVIMIILAVFTAYSFLKRDKDSYDEEIDDDYDYDYLYEEEDGGEYYGGYDDNSYDEAFEEYMEEDEEYDEEYYDDEE